MTMNHFRSITLYIIAAVILAAASSCDKEETDYVLSPDRGNGTVTQPVQSADVGALIELPAMLPGNSFVCHKAKVGKDSLVNYCVEYDPVAHHSRWVAFRFDNALAAKSVGRKDYDIRPQYPQDPDCPACLPDDAYFAGYDHGHLCASADRLCCREANDQTFYMTNMSPQYGAFNQDYWTAYESYVQGLGRRTGFADTLYVVKGGTIREDQRLTTIRSAGQDVAVPKYYFIALLKVKNNAYSAIALWVEHEANPRGSGSREDISQHVISIDELEEKTGIDFFVNLPDKVEEAVESIVVKGVWEL